jgi:hypothetical protein
VGRGGVVAAGGGVGVAIGAVSVVAAVVGAGDGAVSGVVVVTVVIVVGDVAALGACALGSWVESVVTSVTGAAGLVVSVG